MANFDVPNEEELKPGKVYNYDLIAGQYDISQNRVTNTYDQFITLRDTLVFSDKYYPNNAGRSLIIGTKPDGTATGTIEIRTPNISKMSFEPGYESDPTLINDETQGKYIKAGSTHTFNTLACTINKDGRYRISHKEQLINLDTGGFTRVHSIVAQHTGNDEISRAVFDRERANAGDIIRLTSYGYVECDLKKDDWLELVILDQDDNGIPSSYLQAHSNRRSVEYIDLAYN